MREEMNTIEISIPQELDQRVRQAMGQVRAIHRRRILRRAGAAMGSFAAVVGVLLGMAAVNPAMASQIPLVGDWLGSLFYQVNYDSKVGTTGAFVETYEAMEDVNAAAASGEWQVEFGEGYTDGYSLVVSMELTGPQEALEQYRCVWVDTKGGVSAAVNGEPAQVEGVNAFEERDGKWATTMTVEVPSSQQEADSLEVDVTLSGLTGEIYDEAAADQAAQDQIDRLEWEANPDTAGTPYPEEAAPDPLTYEEVGDSFSVSFTLPVDREHGYRFTCQAEDNGAQVLAVSGTPAQTVITVEKPFWGLGDSIVETQVPALGTPVLVLPDGTELTWNVDRSRDLGGYDYQATETQTADLYFDGLPEGTTQVELRFEGNSGYIQKGTLAAFTINLTNGTVVPSEG